MRKIALYMLLVMALGICGCGKTEETDISSQSEESLVQEAVKEEENIVFTAGKIENGSYENPSIRLAFDVTEDMYVLTGEQISKVYAQGCEEMTGEECEAVIPEGITYDAMVYLPDMLSNVIVQVEDVTVTFPEEEMTADLYVQKTIAALSEIEEINYTISDVMTKEIGEAQYLYYEADTGIGFVKYCYVRKLGNYMISVLITEADGSEEMVDALMASLREI